ncbi:MAG: BTAD domain-containing putative transcriptional regulator [Gammaproteobacteria bacterium]|nr:BTAD domain-containing putative transcriptional regulator [Gammaproteobacteria bacterium]
MVQRTSLFERMEQGTARGIVWVAGPAGAGKTTLVSSYLEHRRLTHLWYQVDRGDVDAATFFHYLGLAAARERSLDGASLPSMAGGRGGDVATFSRRYFRELYRSLAAPFALVFDNYQEAPLQSPLSLIVNVALEEIPRSGAVIVVSRSEPPRELARLRANQRIELIGWSELRLSLEEVQAMARKRGQPLGEDASLSLYHRTQGWAAGAVLMLEHAKVMGTEAEPPGDDTPQVIFDYVAGEIFDGFEPESQAFLLSTACLTQMTAGSAERVSGYSKAGRLLANLARNDYFVSERIAEGQRVYQYHPLLSAFLRSRTRQTYSLDEWIRLVRRSARLLADEGQIDDAVTLLLDEGQWQDATALIVSKASEILGQGRDETLKDWLEDLPAVVAAANPWVLYWQGAIRHRSAPRESRRFYERAYDGFCEETNPDTNGIVLACCGCIDAIIHELDDLSLLDVWMDELETQWHSLRDTLGENVALRVTRSMVMSLLLRRPGAPEFAIWVDHALEACRQNPSAALRVGLVPVAALALIWSGHHVQASELIDLAHHAGADEDPAGSTPIRLAFVESVQNLLAGNLSGADSPGVEQRGTAAAGDPAGWSESATYRALSHLNDGAPDAAERALDEQAAIPMSASRLERGLAYYVRSWLSIWRDDRLSAHQQTQAALGVATELGSPAFETLCRLAWVEALAACGDIRKAEGQLRHVTDAGLTLGSALLEQMTRLTAARIALDGDRHESAVEALEAALAIGRSRGFTRTFWWSPRRLAELCVLALSHGIEENYVRHLIRSHRLDPGEAATDLSSWPWHFQIHTLGRFRLFKEGSVHALAGKASRRPIALLKLLVALGGRDVRVDHLTDMLWPNVDGDYAYGSFTSTLHRLRRSLELEDALVLQDGRLSLNSRYFWVDVWALEKVFIDADQQMSLSVGFRSMTESAERMLGLYKGAFLEDESESTAYIALREHLRGKVLRLLGKIDRNAKTPSQLEAATGYYERAIDADPVCEGLYRNLMILYDALDRRADALNVFHRCRTVLTTTLRASPSLETVALYEKLGGESTAGR